jgi:hypothetical protein
MLKSLIGILFIALLNSSCYALVVASQDNFEDSRGDLSLSADYSTDNIKYIKNVSGYNSASISLKSDFTINNRINSHNKLSFVSDNNAPGSIDFSEKAGTTVKKEDAGKDFLADSYSVYTDGAVGYALSKSNKADLQTSFSADGTPDIALSINNAEGTGDLKVGASIDEFRLPKNTSCTSSNIDLYRKSYQSNMEFNGQFKYSGFREIK